LSAPYDRQISDADDFRDDVVLDSAVLLGVWAYRVPRPSGEPKRALDPEILEIIRRVEEAKIREYFKRRRAS